MGLVAAIVVGFVVRLVYVMGPAHDRILTGDNLYYHGVAHLLSRGDGFIEPLIFGVTGERVESATHPPLFPMVLAVPTKLGIDTPVGHRIVTVLIGMTLIPLVYLVATRLAGQRAGVWAAFIAALYPAFWMNDVNVLSEALLAPLVAAIVLVSLIAAERHDWQSALGLGALTGLAALTRAETLLLLLCIAVPMLWRHWRQIAITGAAAAVVIAPWVGYNLTRFEEPVLLSNNLGATLASANCESVYYGERIGWWAFSCHEDKFVPDEDESVRDRQFRHEALEYVRDHELRAPVVAAVRVGRIWNVYRPWQTADIDGIEGRGKWPPRLALAMFVPIVIFAVLGARELRRNGKPISWLVGPIVLVTFVAAAFYGSPRFRVPADVVLTIAAGIGVSAVVRSRTTTPPPQPSSPVP